MNIKLLSGALGAEINGIDLKDASVENFKKINKLFLEQYKQDIHFNCNIYILII